MALASFLLLLAFVCFRSLISEREAYAYVILIGFLQDPVRKLVAGEPIYLTITVGVVIGAIFIRQVFVAHQSLLEPFSRWSPKLITPLALYFLIIALQGIHAFVSYGSMFLVLLGAIFYIAPLLAIVVGYSMFKHLEVVLNFIRAHAIGGIVVAATVLISFSGVNAEIFKEVGTGLLIYDQGTVLRAYSGIMRSSEVASWHMGASVCFLIILMTYRSRLSTVLIASGLVLLLGSAIVLTGRRKTIVQILVFIMIYFPLLRYYQGRLSERFAAASIALIVLIGFSSFLLPNLQDTDYELYLARGVSVFEDAGDRFGSLGLGSIGWAYKTHGALGGGLGVATQGSQHFVEGRVGGAGEGGLGKIVSELGLVSLPLIFLLGLLIMQHLHNCVKLVASVTSEKLFIVVGIQAFIAANIPTFIVASQVFGDVFVLLILGLTTGALFAIPRQVTRVLEQQQVDRRLVPA